ncbi:MAG TPA: TIGR01212 family radical SAM protein [Desulfuromonadales bacterium]|nr:TIGR01212 family radical SAM protein [Desulfuromonadales bacterium]
MSGKRYTLFSTHLKEYFGCRVHKISVDAGFGCPNRGGGRSPDGCLFCDPGGSGATGIRRQVGVAAQLDAGKEVMSRKYKAGRYLAYFQPFSNTYAAVSRLRQLYDEALGVTDVVGLMVGTRPDCVAEDVMELLEEYHRRTYFWLELGLQSIHDATLARLRRGHDAATFLDAYARAKRRNLRVCVHVILGLPGESRREMLATVEFLGRMQVDGIKLHLLHVLDNTPLGRLYRKEGFEILEQQTYVEIVADALELLPPATLIHRLTGDGPREQLLAPLWSLNKWEVLNAIDAELERRGTVQGSRVAPG